MACLRSLKDLQTLPEPMQEQLTALEAKQQVQPVATTLTHGHLNRMHRARNQVQAQARKIQELDQDWKKFTADANLRLQEHAAQFQRHRAELVEVYHRKLKDWEDIKAEISSASQSLVEQQPQLEPLEPAPQVQMDVGQFQTMAQQIMETEEVQFLEADDEETEPMEEMDEEGKKSTKKLAPRAFSRAAGSPHRVAKDAIKVKQQSNKEKETKDRT